MTDLVTMMDAMPLFDRWRRYRPTRTKPLVCILPYCRAGGLWPTLPADRLSGRSGDGALHLPHLQAALAAGTEGLIVALGSSSTQGAMASDSAHTYPAILQAALSKALPAAHLAVINRGIGGQDAPEELARLDTDAMAVHPQLVIWQVGANGAMRHADPAEFHLMVEDGVDTPAEGRDRRHTDGQPALTQGAGGGGSHHPGTGTGSGRPGNRRKSVSAVI